MIMKMTELVSKETLERYLEEEATKLYQCYESAVKRHKPGNAFDLSGVVDNHIPHLIELINSNPNIDNLFCDGCNIGNRGVKLLAQGLKHIKQLSLDATDLGHENPDKTSDTIIALAESNIKTLIISRTILTNDDIDLLIAHSRQTKIILGNNWHIDDDRKEKADQKTRENSAKLLELTFLGASPSKRPKTLSDSEKTSPADSPESNSVGKNN